MKMNLMLQVFQVIQVSRSLFSCQVSANGEWKRVRHMRDGRSTLSLQVQQPITMCLCKFVPHLLTDSYSRKQRTEVTPIATLFHEDSLIKTYTYVCINKQSFF